MRRFIATSAAVALWIMAIGSSAVERIGEPLTVLVSQTIVLPAEGVTRVAIGDDALLDVRVLSDVSQLLLIGQAEGITDIRIWFRNGDQVSHQVTILTEAPQNKLVQVNEALSEIEGVQARQVGNRIIIEGQVLTAQDYARVEAIAKLHRAVNFTAPVGLNVEAMIYFDVKVVEIRKQSLTRLGIDWATSSTGPPTRTSGTTAPTICFGAQTSRALPTVRSSPTRL